MAARAEAQGYLPQPDQLAQFLAGALVAVLRAFVIARRPDARWPGRVAVLA